MKKHYQIIHRNKQGFFAQKQTHHLKRKGKTYQRARQEQRSFNGSVIVRAPKNVDIYSHFGKDNYYEDTIKFCNDIEKKVKNESILISFIDTEWISAAAMLVLYSTIERAFTNYGHGRISIAWSKKSKMVNRFLKRTHLSGMISSGKPSDNLFNRRSLPVISGYGNIYIDEIIDFIRDQYYESDMDPNVEFRFGDAVSETINNVGRHAYPNKPDELRKWWLLCDVVGDDLYLAIYDSGVGIPNTVVEKKWFYSSLKLNYPEIHNEIENDMKSKGLSDLTKMFTFYAMKKLDDHHLIMLSMKKDYSGTKLSKHGQGSKSIKALVNETENGKLWIYSEKGLYTLESANHPELTDTDKLSEAELEDKLKPKLYSLPKKLSGTLVQWNIKLK
ncbi:hypothetical protein AB6F25_21960 [Vibrio splendidus]